MDIPLPVSLLDRDRILPILAIPLLVLCSIQLLIHWTSGDIFLVYYTSTAIVAFSIPLGLFYLKEGELARYLFFAFLLIICTSSAILLGRSYGLHAAIMVIAMLSTLLFKELREVTVAILISLACFILTQISFLYGWQIHEPQQEEVVKIAFFSETASILCFVLFVYLYLQRERSGQSASSEYTQTLESENKALHLLSYHISHDFRQSMRNITQYSQLLSAKYATAGRQFESIESDIRVIEKSARHANQLIQEITMYLSVKDLQQLMVAVDLNELVEEVRQSMEEDILAKSATFTVVQPLPVVRGIRFEWVFLFQNLLENALKYCPKENPLILVSAIPQGDTYVVLFQDNGGGVNPACKDQLFQPFFRLDQHKDQEGSGMGLFICKEIVGRMGGSIRMESEPGEGTSFFITVPAEAIGTL